MAREEADPRIRLTGREGSHAVKMVPYSWCTPTGQYLEECPQVKGHVLGLSDRHAKLRRSGYRKSAAR